MSMPYPQQPAGQPAAPYAPGQPVYRGVPQGYSTAPQGFRRAMRLCLKGL